MVIEGVIADGTSRRAFPLKMHERRTLQPKFSTWNWDGWLLDRLQLAFVQVGAVYPPLLSSALARLIFTLHAAHGPNSISPPGDQQNVSSNSADRVRISVPAATSSSKGHTAITQFCSRTLCVPLLIYQAEDAGYLITQITSICGEALGCHPHDQRSLYDQGHAALWQTVAAVILEGYFAAYVIAGVDVTISSTCQLNDNIMRKERATHNASDSLSVSEVAHQIRNLGNATMHNHVDLKNVIERISEIESGVGSHVGSRLQESGRKTLQNRQRVIEQILNFPISLEDSAEDGSGNLGVGNGSSVLFSEMLEQCAADETGLSPWLRLEAGQFVFNTKNYSLISSDFSGSALEIPNIQSPTGPIQPCNIGQHTGLMLTVREKHEILKLRLTVQVGGNRTDLDLRPILDNWRFGVILMHLCGHAKSTPLRADLRALVTITGVGRHLFSNHFSDARGHSFGQVSRSSRLMEPSTSSIRISMVEGNPQARFLAFADHGDYPPWYILLDGTVCLNCAVEKAQRLDGDVIIVV